MFILPTHDVTQRAYVAAVDLSSIDFHHDSKTDVVVSINAQTVRCTPITIVLEFITYICKITVVSSPSRNLWNKLNINNTRT